MRTTDKYSKIFGEAENSNPDKPATGSYQQQQSPPLQTTRDFDVIATEVRAIITKAYQADEPKNIQS
ncbi:MAG: hypothetical protein JSS64_07705 [Bacteroidetes bacterium]|nr:hypothetical protein [Bacteroidota bacterium]